MHPDEQITSAITGFFSLNALPDRSILAAVSGGSDSVALVLLLHRLKKRLNLTKIGIAHVHHGLRDSDADDDEIFVRHLAAQLHMQYHCTYIQGKKKNDSGIEAWARQRRYAFLKKEAEDNGYRLIATGHTANDQAETVIMRILRGTGIIGARGILPVREDGIIRPLLTISRDRLRQWLVAHGHSWREDLSNTDRRFRRNWIRHELFPLIVRHDTRAIECIARFAENMQALDNSLHGRIAVWQKSFIVDLPGRFLVKKIGCADRALATEAIADCLRKHSIPFARSHIRQILEFVRKNSGKGLLPGGWQFHCNKNELIFTAPGRTNIQTVPLPTVKIPVNGTIDYPACGWRFTTTLEQAGRQRRRVKDDPYTARLDADIAGETIRCRPLEMNELFHPWGKQRPGKVGHFLKKQGVPSKQRNRICGIVNGAEQILWIPGMRITQHAGISAETQRILKISCKSGFC